MRTPFKTHTGEVIPEARFMEACRVVAEEIRENGHAILMEDAFASHVTPEEKQAYVQRYNFDVADRLEQGEVSSFMEWQRVNEVITGECVALLP